ncbi:hypothetical protein LFB80_001846, partial [Salmonella enterica]|nr:hypothetical protein [Salmonella enterica]EIF7897453.1 hypothetical protein [Salmonella enterica]
SSPGPLPNQNVFPAPAGINRAVPVEYAGGYRVPRASGDKPGIALAVASVAVCSPRQRG